MSWLPRLFLVSCLLVLSFVIPAQADKQRCVRTQNILWGDGRHDDAVALNAWLLGEDAVWADTGKSVGAAIAGRSFRLASAIYVIGGTGRSLSDFRLLFPEIPAGSVDKAVVVARRAISPTKRGRQKMGPQ